MSQTSTNLETKTTRAIPGLIRFIVLWLAGLCLAVIVFHQNVMEHTHTFFAGWDSSAQSYAWNVANAQAIRDGTVKLWDFTTSSGTSFAGEMQTAPFYPANWIFAWMADPSSVELQEWRILAHFGLAFAGAYALLRHNRRGRAGAAAGAILTTFIGSFTLRSGAQPNIFESLCYMPLVVWLSQRAMESACTPWKCPRCWQAGAACGLMVLAGHMQPPIHTGLAVALLAAFLPPFSIQGMRHRALRLAMVGGVALLIALPQVAATVEYMALSYRWIGAEKPTPPPHHVPYAIYAFKYVLQWSDWRLLFSPRTQGAEGSTLFLGFSGLGLVMLGLLRWTRISMFGACLGALAFLIALGGNSLIGQLSYYVPGLSTIRTPVRTLCLYHLAAGILAAGGVDFLVSLLHRLPGRFVFPLTALPAAIILTEAAAYSTLHMQARQADLYPKTYYDNTWLREQSHRTIAEPGKAFRYIALPNDSIPPNLGNVDGSLSMRGHRATMQMRYFKYLRRDWSPVGENFRRLGLRYIFSHDPLPLPALSSHGGLTLYERPDALSVFQIIENTKARSARIDAIRWSHNHVHLAVTSGEAGLLVFAQVRYPGWQASIDGRKVPLQKEDVFIAVDLPVGAREVTFDYRPWWLWPGCLASIGGMLATAVLLFRPRHTPQPKS